MNTPVLRVPTCWLPKVSELWLKLATASASTVPVRGTTTTPRFVLTIRFPWPFPDALGVKTTLITQLPPSGTVVAPHELVWEKSPLIQIAFTVMGTELGKIETCCAPLLVPAACGAKFRDEGDATGGLDIPSPVSDTVTGGADVP
jgi:hypothetical protein